MSGPMKYNYPGIQMASSGITTSKNHLDGQLDQIKASMQVLAGVWGGTSSTDYQALQNKTNAQFADLSATVADLASRLATAGIDMQTTDAANGGLFHGV